MSHQLGQQRQSTTGGGGGASARKSAASGVRMNSGSHNPQHGPVGGVQYQQPPSHHQYQDADQHQAQGRAPDAVGQRLQYLESIVMAGMQAQGGHPPPPGPGPGMVAYTPQPHYGGAAPGYGPAPPQQRRQGPSTTAAAPSYTPHHHHHQPGVMLQSQPRVGPSEAELRVEELENELAKARRDGKEAVKQLLTDKADLEAGMKSDLHKMSSKLRQVMEEKDLALEQARLQADAANVQFQKKLMEVDAVTKEKLDAAAKQQRHKEAHVRGYMEQTHKDELHAQATAMQQKDLLLAQHESTIRQRDATVKTLEGRLEKALASAAAAKAAGGRTTVTGPGVQIGTKQAARAAVDAYAGRSAVSDQHQDDAGYDSESPASKKRRLEDGRNPTKKARASGVTGRDVMPMKIPLTVGGNGGRGADAGTSPMVADAEGGGGGGVASSRLTASGGGRRKTGGRVSPPPTPPQNKVRKMLNLTGSGVKAARRDSEASSQYSAVSSSESRSHAMGRRTATATDAGQSPLNVNDGTVIPSRESSAPYIREDSSPAPDDPIMGDEIERRFVITSLGNEELKQQVIRAIQELGQQASVLDDYEEVPPFAATHFITTEHPRSVKAFCGLVSGRYVTTPDYVFKSLKAGFWLDEVEEELVCCPHKPVNGKRVVLRMDHNQVLLKAMQSVVRYGGGILVDPLGEEVDSTMIILTSGEDLLNYCLGCPTGNDGYDD